MEFAVCRVSGMLLGLFENVFMQIAFFGRERRWKVSV